MYFDAYAALLDIQAEKASERQKQSAENVIVLDAVKFGVKLHGSVEKVMIMGPGNICQNSQMQNNNE